jgi:hypothetical protein
MKKYILFVLLFFFSFSFAQTLNEYKYALVPSKFTFLKEKDDYKLNTLAKLLMEKYGFTAYLDSDVLPDEVLSANCNKVYVDVINLSNFLTTKLKVVLKDCKGNVLFTSPEGTSREKEYRVAYSLALRMAFDNFSVLKSHNFQPSQKNMGMIGEKSSLEPLFAKPLSQPLTGNGFQLLTNNTNIPQYVMTIYKTSSPDCYIVAKENLGGVLLQKSGTWFFEYYKDNKLVSEQILIVNF